MNDREYMEIRQGIERLKASLALKLKDKAPPGGKEEIENECGEFMALSIRAAVCSKIVTAGSTSGSFEGPKKELLDEGASRAEEIRRLLMETLLLAEQFMDESCKKMLH